MNEHHIKNLRIENFKSIKEMELDCSRINVFVGKPNVGKSNILEAIGLYGIDGNHPDKFIRFEQVKNFFPFNDNKLDIKIKSDIGEIDVKFHRKEDRYHLKSTHPNGHYPQLEWDNKGSLFSSENMHLLNKVKRYIFKPYDEKFNSNELHLVPPYGNNLFTILETNVDLSEAAGAAFRTYGLELTMDTERNKILVQRKIRGLSYFVPFNLVADTLQRKLFHYAAIFSNEDTIILFEEPESHAYPPYISSLAYKMIDAETNQFFVSTHSPYLLNALMENTPPEDLSVFVVTYKDYESQIYKLNEQDYTDIATNGVDLFFNLRWFDNE